MSAVRAQRRHVTIPAVLLVAATIVVIPATSRAVSSGVVISQVYGGGGNSGATFSHDFIELFNRGTSPVALNGWSVQYGSATGDIGAAATTRTDLPNVTLAPGQYLLIREAQGSGGTTVLPAPFVSDSSPIAMSATDAKVAVVNTTTPLACGSSATPCSAAKLATVVDLVGYGSANLFEGASAAPTLTNTTAALRDAAGCTDTDDNALDFAGAAPTPRNADSPLNACGNVACGGPLTTAVGFAATRTMTARDPDGVVVDIEVTGVTPSPAPGSIAAGDTDPAMRPGGTASVVITVDENVPVGTYTVTVTASTNDAPPATDSCNLTVRVLPLSPLGAVQGVVSNSANALTQRSPFAAASGNGSGAAFVAVKAVVYEETLARTSVGAANFGLFIQNTDGTDDNEPNSSDGIFVFLGTSATIPTNAGGTYSPTVGDEIVLAGRVSEFFNLTQFAHALQVIGVVDTGVEISPFDIDPPDVLADANRFWERHEGMLGSIPAGSKVVGARDVFPSTADGEAWLIRGDHPVALREDPYARRVFRDPHPLDDDPDQLFDNGNGYRIVLGSLGLKAAVNDNETLIAPARMYDTVVNELAGGVYFSFAKYQVQIVEDLDLTQGVDPSLNAPPEEFDRAQRFSIATYNVENLYDRRDDPFDGCDFTGNPGCPGVFPPFDYVPASQEDYEAHLEGIAEQIVDDLHEPDVILIQEAEDQDICTITDGALVCGTTNNADGKPDTLQELTLAIADAGGRAYDAAYDRDGADDRGIVSAFLHRTDRVELLPPDPNDPVLGSSPTVDYRGDPFAHNTDVQNPKTLNADLPSDVDTSTGIDGSNVFTRPPQVALFRIWQTGVGEGTSYDLYALSNHFSSTPDARVGQRTEQAAYDAAIVDALQDENADVRVAVGGDFNVYPRPDDPFAPGHPLFPSDQLKALYNQGLLNLWNVLVEDVPMSAYSYEFQGQTQTLDQIFLTQSLFENLTTVRSAHINADWPAGFDGDGARGESDHDPLVSVLCRDETAPTIIATPDELWPPNHRYVDVTVTAVDDADPAPTFTFVSAVSNEPDNAPGPDDGNTSNDVVQVDNDTVRLRAERSDTGTGREYTLAYATNDSCGNTANATAVVTVPIEQ